jgi:hypothetical protein
MSRIAGERKEFQEYLRDYDRRARGAGSEKDPAVDRDWETIYYLV